jgi:hypothetical protein
MIGDIKIVSVRLENGAKTAKLLVTIHEQKGFASVVEVTIRWLTLDRIAVTMASVDGERRQIIEYIRPYLPVFTKSNIQAGDFLPATNRPEEIGTVLETML